MTAGIKTAAKPAMNPGAKSAAMAWKEAPAPESGQRILPSQISLQLMLALMAGIILHRVMADGGGGGIIGGGGIGGEGALLPSPLALAAMGIALMASALVFLRMGDTHPAIADYLHPLCRVILMAVPAAMLGYGVAVWHGEGREAGLSAPIPASPVTAGGHVVMAEAMTGTRTRIRFAPDGDGGGGGGGDWRLIIPADAPRLHPGDEVILTAHLSPPLPQLLPGGFDFAGHAKEQGYTATGFADRIRVLPPGEGGNQAGIIPRLRNGMQNRIAAALGGESDEAAIASALLTGLRGLLSPDLREAFRASGLAHLLAISGLHMALFCGSVLFILRFALACFPAFASRYPALKIAAIISLPFGGIYLLVSGMPVSAMRAYGMVCFVILAIMVDRRGLTLHHVAMMAILLLLLDPQNLYDPAYRMSFAAVFALVASWMLRQRWRLTRFGLRGTVMTLTGATPLSGMGRSLPMRLITHAAEVAVASLIASTASMPFVVYHFGVTTAWSVVANIIGIPLMALAVMPTGALAMVLMPFGLEWIPLAAMGKAIALLVAWVEIMAGLPLAHIAVKPPPQAALILLVLVMVLPFAMAGKWQRPVLIPSLLVAAAFLWIRAEVPILAVTEIHGRMHIAIRDDAGRVVFARRRVGGFSRNVMLRPFGIGPARAFYVRDIAGGDGGDGDGAVCGRGYCITHAADGMRIAVVWQRFALTEACRSEADVVVSYEAAQYPCASGAMIIDPPYLAQSGGLLGYGEDGAIRLQTVKGGGGL